MKKRFLSIALALTLAASLAAPASAEGEIETQESAGAPPAVFDVYIEVGDNEPMLFTSYTGTDMRRMAINRNKDKNKLKYSSMSYSGAAGRIVTEYITLDDFLDQVGEDTGTLCFGSGDYWIMGPDYTQDPAYSDYSKKQLMFNWYSYDSVVGTERYYYPNWDSGDDSDPVAVPAVIGLKSYGDSSGMSDELLDMYTGSADYLWAYVLYYGQTDVNQITYSTFYRQQEQAVIRYDESAPANETVLDLLGDKLAEAERLLENTVVGSSSDSVAQGKFWVTQAVYSALEAEVEKAGGIGEDATNGSAYAALLSLESECSAFAAARRSGMKSGFFWYTDNDSTTYTISNVQQLIELGQIVSGTAVDASTQESIAQDSFYGKTVVLGCDIAAGGARINIGNDVYSFDGTFDGRGYEITGISATYTSGGSRGLFGSIGENGVVKNFTLTGSVGVKNQASYIGGVAGRNAGTIESVRCMVDVASPRSSLAGGIAGENSGTIRDCLYVGEVEADSAFGALAGKNSGGISGCLNASALPTAGENEADGSITACIASQAVIAEKNGGSISGCYTLGSSPVSEQVSGGVMESVYYVGSGAYEGATGVSGASELCSEAVLKALEPFDSFVGVESGLPCLGWQKIYSVYYELMLDGNTMDPAQAGEYLPVIRPENPTALKYSDGKPVADTERVFAGWYSDKERRSEYDFAALAESDITLYAAWKDPDGKNVRVLRINTIRVSEDGAKSSTETFFCSVGETYSYKAERFDNYVGPTDMVTGVMADSDVTVELYYYRFGDVNRDGRINALDAMLVLRTAASLTTPDAQQLGLADTDGNGSISSDDALRILMYSVGKIDSI